MVENKSDVKRNSKICGLVLSAGYSSRMGRFKPLLPIGDSTAIERVIETLKKANIENILVVTGYNQQLLEPILKENLVQYVHNKNYSEGMFSSIKTGIGWSLLQDDKVQEHESEPDEVLGTDQTEAFLLMLVDSPLIPPEIIKLIVEKHEEVPESFIVPCYRGKKGHPLLIPAMYVNEILSYEGEGGLKAVTNRYEDKLIKIEVDNEAVVLDMDTPEGYLEVLQYHEEHPQDTPCERVKIQPKGASSGRKLFLIRHGEVEQHEEKIFLGQTDIPLSNKGRKQARIAGLKLITCLGKIDKIYTSDLCRATETTKIIAGVLDDCENNKVDKNEYNKIKIIIDSSLREIDLGEWDGYFIREIKERYPEEYKKRGENILTYKYGNNSENFYDLQYRVMKSLGNILKLNEQGTQDIVIVAHGGVIKVILSNLLGSDLLEEVKKTISNGEIKIVEL